jgi:hypothetical protein
MVILCAASPLTCKTRTRVKRMHWVVSSESSSDGKVSSFLSSV